MSEQEKFNFATIGEVYEDGVSLVFDGNEEPSQKHYKVNTSIVFSPGDRVKILSDCGTYVVEYIVGNPAISTENEEVEDVAGLPQGGTEGQYLRKNSADDFDASWEDVSQIPSGGTAGYVLGKKTDADGDVWWTYRVDALRDANSNSRAIWLRYVSGTGFQIRGSNTSWITLTTK